MKFEDWVHLGAFVIFEWCDRILKVTADPEVSVGSLSEDKGKKPCLDYICNDATNKSFNSLVGAHCDQFCASK